MNFPEYIYQEPDWPNFTWDSGGLADLIAKVSFARGKLLGKMDSIGFDMQKEASLIALSQEIIKSSEIEGEILNLEQVRSSVARRLNITYKSSKGDSHYIDGIVNMMMDATSNYAAPLIPDRLFSWHAALFPTGYSGMDKIDVAKFRSDRDGRMQVISFVKNRKNIHFEAPEAKKVPGEVEKFLAWINSCPQDIMSAAKAHLWFVTIHPFDDGNGRITRAITEMMLARADASKYRFYSMSNQIQKDRDEYYKVLEKTQRGGLDITPWMEWFANAMLKAIEDSLEQTKSIFRKAKFWQDHSDMDFSANQCKILNRLFDGFEGNLTTAKWAKICKCSHDTAIRAINDLIQKGVLKKEGDGKSTHYVLA